MTTEPIKAFLSQPYGRTAADRVFWDSFRAAIREVATSFADPSLEIVSAGNTIAAFSLKDQARIKGVRYFL